MLIKKLFQIVSLVVVCHTLYAESHSILWEIEHPANFQERLSFEDAVYRSEISLPIWTKSFNNRIVDQAYLENEVFEAISQKELSLIEISDIEAYPIIKISLQKDRIGTSSIVEVLPIRFNAESKTYEKLISFDLEIIEAQDHSFLYGPQSRKVQYADNSVLSNGDWFKIGVTESGVYLLNFNFLNNLDASFSGSPINSIKVFGNGGNMLSENNDDPRVDDLAENPIQAFDQNGNGTFDAGDFFLFYADGTDNWTLSDGRFDRTVNIYSDTSYYFVTKESNNAKRIQSRISINGQANQIFTVFDERQQHQLNEVNLIKSGREWYGELFDFTLSRDFNFSIPNLATAQDLCLRVNAVARHTPFNSSSNYQVKINGNTIGSGINMQGSASGYGKQYDSRTLNACVNPQSLGIGDNFSVNIQYNKNGNTNAKGYLNFITVEAKRNLIWTNTPLNFRQKASVQGGVYEFQISNAPSDLIIWDITDPINPIRQNFSQNGSQASFKYQGMPGIVNEFIAFSPTSPLNPVFFQKLNNQNLHAQLPKDLVVITHPAFNSEAQRFAEYKKNVMGLDVLLVDIREIYNEFSSGRQDLMAIRDYLKMLYNKDSKSIANVLLFGDCSYDYKYRIPGNTNFIPVFESYNSTNDISSVSSDDYIAIFEDVTGWAQMNVGVGRFPVKTLEEARVVVDKVIHYENSKNLFGKWLNKITFVADDGDSNTHMRDADEVARVANNRNPALDIQKIYLDAYPEISSPSGALSIEGKNALDRAIQDGTLILNYSGHGGEIGWTEEQILRLDQISQWGNYEKLAFFFTATCEFGRYDDPGVVSGGELVLLVGNGGAAGIMTTTRPVFSASNKNLNIAFYNNIFLRDSSGNKLTLGEVISRTKNQNADSNNRSFALLGDPSMKLNYPDKKVLISEINQQDPLIYQDTLNALCLINVKGEVADLDSIKMSNFNGFVDLKVYDKEINLNTLGNNGSKFAYSQYKNLLFSGKASVINGSFSVDFVVPKDIDYSFGKGKILSYAYDSDLGIDANGFEDRFYVGGSCENVVADNAPPLIRLYLDDTTFTPGSLTSSSPELIAFLSDENGINFTGTGIGHDITSTVSAVPGEKIILNDYYLSELDNYQKGRVNYQLKNLPDGEHTLILKAWDTHNNSSEESVSFIVASSEEMALKDVMNYPNPFSRETFFAFDHNNAGDDLVIELQITDRMGRLVKSGMVKITESDTKVDGINYSEFRWDGKNDQQQNIASGVYFYKIIVRSEQSGRETSEVKRLVYIK